QGVIAAGTRRLKRVGDGEVRGIRQSRDEGGAGGIHRDAAAVVDKATTQVRGKDQTAAIRSEARHESVIAAAVIRLQWVGGGKAWRIRRAPDEDLAGGRVYGKSVPKVGPAAAEVGGKDQGTAIRTEPRHEDVRVAATVRLQRVGCGEVRGKGRSYN